MRKKLIILLCTLICLFVACGFIVLGANSGNTTIPNYFLDFTSSNVHFDLGVTNQVEVDFKDGYTTMVANGTDPYVYLPAPEGELSKHRYVLIMFRTTSAGGGEIYCAKDDGIPMGQSELTHTSWSSWEATGDWQTKIIDISSMCTSGTEFINFRFDPFTNNTKGASIDIKCIASFASESDAKGFDLDKYLKSQSVNDSWQQPEYREMETTPDDIYGGTLKYTNNADGTVTISYMYNGAEKSYTVPNDPIYTSGGFAGTDDVGRSLFNSNAVGVYGDNGEHYVGIFYFLWMGMHGDPGVYDLTKIQHKYGQNARNANFIDPETGNRIYGQIGQMHWMGEPLYGYYYSSDEWVMRKHVELLTNAGVDFLYIDVTNAQIYSDNAKKLMKVLHEYNEMGYNAPKIVFYTNTNSGATIIQLYREIYRRNVYPDTWLYVDGKPCVIGNVADVTNAEVKEFFTYKVPQWPNDPTYHDNAWPWMDFSLPQRVFKDSEGNRSAISVSVAQHSGSVAFSDSAYYFTPATENNRGRSYKRGTPFADYKKAINADSSLTNYGYNFQNQWDYAIKQDVPYVLVTGWNEWVAQRQDGLVHRGDANKVLFIDTASMEFSRDIEMMRGGYFDNYYMQLIYNIQRLKGTAPVIIQDARNPINITAGFDQWSNVKIEYTDPRNDMVNRSNLGFGTTYYRDNSGRNDIVSSKVTNDTKNVYFYVETADNVKKYDGSSSWMQLYVNADQDSSTGWYGYDYIINYSPKGDLVTTVAKYIGTNNKFIFKEIGEVDYTVSGNQMMIAVPLDMLGIKNYNGICLEFKWFDADSGVRVDEMEDFYTYGDAAPLGRLNYVYQNCLAEDIDALPPNVDTDKEDNSETDTSEPNTESNTEGKTDAETDGNTDATADVSVDADTEPTEGDGGSGEQTDVNTPKKGCGAGIGGVSGLIIAICIGYPFIKRKRKTIKLYSEI